MWEPGSPKGEMGQGQLHIDLDVQGRFSQHQEVKNTPFFFCSCLASAEALWCVPGPRPTVPSCHGLRPQTSLRSHVFGNLSVA